MGILKINSGFVNEGALTAWKIFYPGLYVITKNVRDPFEKALYNRTFAPLPVSVR